MKTFGQFFDAVAARPEARGGHRYSMKHDWLRRMTGEEWETLRDSPLTLESFNAFAKRQREYLSMNAAFIPSDSAFNELHDSTMLFLGAVMEVGRQFGLEPDTDWVTAKVPNPPELENMALARRELRKPYSCSIYRVAKATDSNLPDVFVQVWHTPTIPKEPGDWPAGGELVAVAGGETRAEALEKLGQLQAEHKVVVLALWPNLKSGKRTRLHTV